MDTNVNRVTVRSFINSVGNEGKMSEEEVRAGTYGRLAVSERKYERWLKGIVAGMSVDETDKVFKLSDDYMVCVRQYALEEGFRIGVKFMVDAFEPMPKLAALKAVDS